MTVEEKRGAIKQYCRGHDCYECALRGSGNCYTSATEEEIDINYTKLFGDTPEIDRVNHPPHYTQGDIQCIDAMLSAFGNEAVATWCKCNAFKYIWREAHKNGMEDIDKAIWYLNKFKELSASG